MNSHTTEPSIADMRISIPGLLRDGWLVLMLAIVFGSGLALVHVKMAPIIEANIHNETYSLIPVLVGNPPSFHIEETSMLNPAGQSQKLFHVRNDEGLGLGWVIPSTSLGFADRILILVGVDESCTEVLGIRVIDQKETPGLGNFIIDPPFRDQFAGAPADGKLNVVKTPPANPSEILTVTGATISSVSVANGVNQAVTSLRAHLAAASNNQP